MIPAQDRLQGVEQLIDMQQYFVIHAARQSGKTTFLKDFTDRLNEGNKYYCLYCSLESLQEITDPKEGIPQVVNRVGEALTLYKLPYAEKFAAEANFSDFSGVLKSELSKYCAMIDRPLVVLFDEADCLSNGMLITFLRQLRNGYIDRNAAPFVQSIALVGMRNIRDYKVLIRSERETLGSASPFNIVAETMTLSNFTKEEVRALYSQHAAETGQKFDDDAIDFICQQTCGQPWLVNAVAREVIVKKLRFDYSKPVTVALCEQAIQTIILRRDTHIDSFLERLKEERVRSVIEQMIMGESDIARLSDDFEYVRDLGLIKEENKKIIPANPVYAEVIVRTLNYDLQHKISSDTPDVEMPRYIKNGKIDMHFLMTEFQQFWRMNSGFWTDMVRYKEAAPHLVLMAFLQRVVNGGGQILREFAIDSGRTDLGIVYDGITYPVEVKIWKGEQYYQNGLTQTARYIDGLGCNEGVLAIVNRSKALSWDEKIYQKTETVNGKTILVYGM
ncbi:MAG: AAA-like domain-containing protein [Tannerella sp.]|jgi:AAA+ ATPase superfamily predicted ATPase|nr:AAA-like domain-containing protein [Tannerella sp.]